LKTAAIIAILLLASLLIYFSKDLVHLSGVLMLPDRNPQLVNYLQGTWCDTDNPNRCLLIKRDSMWEVTGNRITQSRTLRYEFAAAAGKFFEADSSFSFKNTANNPSEHNAFRLLQIDPMSGMERIDTIVTVSKTELKLLSAGDTLHFKKSTNY